MSKLDKEVERYYNERGLVWPNSWEALGWASTELGEVYETLLADGNWVRNNPDDHPETFDSDKFAEELGDGIMMLQVAGKVRGVDPLQSLYDKMERKLNERNDSLHARGYIGGDRDEHD